MKDNIDIMEAILIMLRISGIMPIVELGCGRGILLHKIYLLIAKTGRRLIGVDPDPHSFTLNSDKGPYLRIFPEYGYYEELGDLGDHCLIIDWPLPNHSTYDYDAIMTRKAKYVVIRYASCGMAGGKKFQKFIKNPVGWEILYENKVYLEQLNLLDHILGITPILDVVLLRRID